MTARPHIAEAVSNALEPLGLSVAPSAVHLGRPALLDHGDWSTNAALVNAKALGRPPRQIAEDLAERVRAAPPPHLRTVEVAGPGFVNFHLEPGWLHGAMAEVIEQGEDHLRAPRQRAARSARRIEFISANPTGPVPHVGKRVVGSHTATPSGA